MSTQSQQNENTWINAQMPLSLRNKAEMLSAEMGLDNLSALIRYLIQSEWKRRMGEDLSVVDTLTQIQ